jgi:Transmembrane domain of unknown function (DUF3566)
MARPDPRGLPTIEDPTHATERARPESPQHDPEPVTVTSPAPPRTTTPAPAPVPPSPRTMRPTSTRKAVRRTRVVIRRVSPLSVLKFSVIFYFCVMLIVFFALLIIYIVLSAAGAMDSFAKVLGWVFGNGTSTLGPEPVKINGGEVFTILFIAGCVWTVVWSVITVFLVFLYNLISDIVGGIEVTLAEPPPR